MSIMKNVTLQKIVALDFRYDPRRYHVAPKRRHYALHHNAPFIQTYNTQPVLTFKESLCFAPDLSKYVVLKAVHAYKHPGQDYKCCKICDGHIGDEQVCGVAHGTIS